MGFDEKMVELQLQKLSPGFDKAGEGLLQGSGDVVVETPPPVVRALRPVVFSLRESNGGRTVRPESVLELHDNDIASATEPGTPTSSSMPVSDKCTAQCSGNNAECSLLAAVCSLQVNRACVGARCPKRL